MPGNNADTWSSEQYSKFEKERNRPVLDLLAHIPAIRVNTAADLGCGPGNSTQLLKDQYPEALITGMDSSANMIDAARKRLPEVHFEVADIAAWKQQGPFDVILANAALQWVPDHGSLFPALIRKLTPAGSLAVQVPDNLDEPAHRLMREIAAQGPWAQKLSGITHLARHNAQWYYEQLHHQVSGLDIWRTTYYHVLEGGAAAIVEWFKSTGLRPFLDPLNHTERSAYLDQYQAALEKAYTINANGTVLLPFPRLFIIAQR